ncbi:amidoligase family protein [Microbulbifer sp. SAOS-129_SWC]|uniref:amidoligase family protein n=1 Tax=Microbulbifer sp. SAOS-129_SWC TaxID=3145235 RepID=UPI0032164D66
MSEQTQQFRQPPVTVKDDGAPRRVGFELEFSGISLDQAADILQRQLGGEFGAATAAQKILQVDGLGEFSIELDWDYLQRTAAERAEQQEDGRWVELLSKTAAFLVPLEVVCPPIPLDKLELLQPLVAALRKAGASGTEESAVAAYGVHINTELPRQNADTLFSYLRAFSLLQWWLQDVHEVNNARRISPYIDLYPDAYVRQLLARKEPTMDDLFRDYLQHNATRNRALDLLPILADIDPARVQRAVDDPKIKPRPAFHYRLPNCQIEKPDWSLADPWRIWCVVEELASRPSDLEELSRLFQQADHNLLGINHDKWLETVKQWLSDRELA